jgi:hypothetical protein
VRPTTDERRGSGQLKSETCKRLKSREERTTKRGCVKPQTYETSNAILPPKRAAGPDIYIPTQGYIHPYIHTYITYITPHMQVHTRCGKARRTDRTSGHSHPRHIKSQTTSSTYPRDTHQRVNHTRREKGRECDCPCGQIHTRAHTHNR